MRILFGLLALIAAALLSALGAEVNHTAWGGSWIGFFVTAIIGSAVAALVTGSARRRSPPKRIPPVPQPTGADAVSASSGRESIVFLAFIVVASCGLAYALGLGIGWVNSSTSGNGVQFAATGGAVLASIMIMFVPVAFASGGFHSIASKSTATLAFFIAAITLSSLYAVIALTTSGLFA